MLLSVKKQTIPINTKLIWWGKWPAPFELQKKFQNFNRAQWFFFLTLFIFNWRIIALHFIVLVSTKHQHESVIGLPMSPPTWTSLPPPSPSTPLGCYWTPVWGPWVIQQIPIGYLFYRWWCMFPCYFLHTSHPVLPPHPDMSIISSPCLCLHCCSANRFISAIFLDSIYMCWYTIFVVLFLTDFTLYNRL